MITLNITEIIEKNKQLERDNEILRKRVLTSMLNENTEITRLNSKIEELKQENKLLRQKYAYLSLLTR